MQAPRCLRTAACWSRAVWTLRRRAGSSWIPRRIFDPTTGEWSPAASSVQVHGNHRAILLEDGRVLLVGGLLSEIYDPETDTWTSAGAPNREKSWGYTATLLNDGRVLVTGGIFLPRRLAGHSQRAYQKR